jgi:hypothetical protein
VELAGKKAKRALGCERCAQARCSGGIEDAFAEKSLYGWGERNLASGGGFCEHGGDNLLVLFRLERASGIDDMAAGANDAQSCGEDCVLALGLAR